MPTIKEVDALLPQTQCTLCGYQGCLPYATAIIEEGAAINLCPPGGVKTLTKLGQLLGQDITPFIEEMQLKTKPHAVAVIREAECIGCMKCITACPVDAILGTGKKMHSVIAKECTGCELCVAPCPVDCIDIIIDTENKHSPNPDHFRSRHYAKNERLALEKEQPKPLLSNHRKKEYLSQVLARHESKKILPR